MLESDIVWEKRALDAMLDKTWAGISVGRAPRVESSLLTSGPTDAGDEVWVWTDGTAGRPTLDALSKSRSFRADTPFGELVGMVRIGEALRKRLLDIIRGNDGARPDVPYETCLTAAAAAIPVELVHVDGLVWGEIDDEAMYARIREKVWPSIATAAAAECRRGQSVDAA
jgi:choline kinase